MMLKNTAIRLMAMTVLASISACAADSPARIGNVATTPLSDLNIVKADIPKILEAAQKQPYLVPVDPGCAAISSEIHQLDEVLGADLDAPAAANAPTLLDRGVEAAGDSAVGALQRTAEGLIPFRGWVRKLSGAERYSRHVSAAIAAGSIRRAFLKGIGVSHACSWGIPSVSAQAAPHPAQTR